MCDYRAIFDAITADPRYLRNLDWGEVRAGHPEGTLRAHIHELEGNLQRLRHKLSETEYWKLRLLIHTHDIFKPDADAGAPISAPRSHASLARAFLSSFCDDNDLLAIVQLHDEPYAIFLRARKGRSESKRFELLLNNIRDWDLFLAFMIIDGCTAGKSREPLQWLVLQLEGKVESRFGLEDIL